MKLTKSQEFSKAWTTAIRMEEAHERWEQYESFKAEVEGKVFKATVVWFNKDRGIGHIQMEDGTNYSIYACNISGKKTWYENTACVYYEVDQEIEVTLSVFIDRVFVNGVTPGIFDADKWNDLDQDKLAFKVKEDGSTTGLFAPGAAKGIFF